MSSIQPPPNSMRILHIDDSPDDREIVKLSLEGIDPEMDIASAASPTESLRMMEELQIDCIVCDYSMPEMNGIELCRRIRETSNVPFIIYTGHGSEEVASIAFEARADDYLRKESGQGHYSVLGKRIRQAVEKHWGEGLYRNVLKNTIDGVVIAQGTRIVYANQATAELMGVSLGELLEKDVFDWIVEGDRERLQSFALGRQRGESPPSRYEVTFRRPDGEHRVMDISSSLIKYKGRSASLGIVRDASEKVRYRERLAALHRCTLELASAESIEEIAKQTLDSIEEVFDFRWGDFSIFEAGRLVPVHFKGVTYEEFEILDLDGPGVIARAARTGESQLVCDTRVDEDYLPFLIDGNVTTLSELALPIKSNGNLIGVINLESPVLDGFSVDDQTLLEIFSQYVASAVVRLRNEGSLRASEEKYRNILESSLDGITVTKETKLVFANQRFAEMLGYDDPSELLGLSSWDLVAPENKALVRERGTKRRAGDRSTFRYELNLARKDGSPFYAESQTSAIDFEGEPSVLGVHRDINERMRLREASRRNEELLKSFMDSATDGFAIFDSEMNYIDMNKALETRSGLKKEDIIGKNISDVLPNLEKAGKLERYREVLETGNPFFIYGVPSSKSDELLAIRAFKVGDGLGVITTQVTYRKQMEEQLRKSEKKYRALLESNLDAVTVSVDNKVVYSNRRSLEILGYDEISELKGMRFLDLVHPDDKETAREIYERRSKGERGLINYTVWVQRKDGQYIHVESRTNGIEYEGREAILSVARDITERKRLEAELRESEERYKNLFALSPYAIVISDMKGCITDVNDAVTRMAGFSRDELIGKHFSRLPMLSRRDIPGYLKIFSSFLSGNPTGPLEIQVQSREGTNGILEMHIGFVEADGEKVGIQAVFKDVTLQKELEEDLRKHTESLAELVLERTSELRESEERFRNVIDNLPMALQMYKIDANGDLRFVAANPIADKTGSISSSQYIGKTLDEGFPNVDKAIKERFKEIAEKGGYWHEEDIHYEGDRISNATDNYIFQTAPGEMASIFRDITKQKLMEEEIRSLARFPGESTNPVLRISGDGNILYANSAAETVLSEWKTEVGMKAPEEWFRYVSAALEEGMQDVEIKIDDRVLSMRIMPIEDAGYVNVYSRDVTDQKQMEESLLMADRLAVVGRIAAMMGHDLRGPLVVIRNAVDLARKRPERTDKALAMIDRNAGQAMDILEELRTRTRDEPVTMAPVEIGELMRKATENILAPDGVELLLEIDDTLPELVMDEAKTMRALDNVIRNALDAMTAGGVLKIGATRERDKVVIRVSDTGPGIPEDTMRNLFKPFYTTKPKGLGLGLASTKHIVEIQGGTISVETRDGEGATFAIALPLKGKNPDQ